MKVVVRILVMNVIFVSVFSCCANKLTSSTSQRRNVIDLINETHQRKVGIKKSSRFSSYDNRIYEIRNKAIELFKLEVDTSKINRFIVIDWINFEGGNFYGEMITNDTSKVFYKSSFKAGGEVIKYDHPVESEGSIVEHLKKHQFKELEALADKRGKSLSGSNFIYIGMYEKSTDRVYVQVLPAFINP